MSKDGSGSEGSGNEPTQIDLGDDLIEQTAIIPGHPSPPGTAQRPPGSPELPDIEDSLQSARILLSEGFPEEAKKILRQILMGDPMHPEARRMLQEIHDSELEQMFGSAETVVRRSVLDSGHDESILSVSIADSEEILRILEHDMRPELRGAAQELSFFEAFREPKELEDFVLRLEKEIGDSPRDRVDLAIGFIEMGLFPAVIRLLQPLVSSSVEKDRVNAVALTACARILSGESYEAISALQPILNDNDVVKSDKTEIFYLMGRALQALSLHAEAIGWFLQAEENEPGYRDCTERVSRSQSARAKGQGGQARGRSRGPKR